MVVHAVPSSRRGWVRIVEAFVAILLITGVVLLVFNQQTTHREDPAPAIYQEEQDALFAVQTNASLRAAILSVSPPLASITPGFPDAVNRTLQDNLPDYLVCIAQICSLESACLSPMMYDKSVYARSALISTDDTTFNPRQLKLFCLLR